MPAAEYSSLAYVNYALGLLGENPITSFDPADGSTNGLAGTVYDRLVETMLCGWPWNFVQQRLTLTADVALPPEPWLAQYGLPSGTLRVIRSNIPSEPWALYQDPTTGERRIYLGRDAASSTLAVQFDVVVRPSGDIFPAYFVPALQYSLAGEMAAAITGDISVAQAFRAQAVTATGHRAHSGRQRDAASAHRQPVLRPPQRRLRSWRGVSVLRRR